MRRSLLVLSSLVLGLSVIACGGGSEEPKTPADKASAQVTPMEELKAIPKDLDAEVASLTKPIDDVQSIIDDLGAFPKKHGMAAADVMGMAKATCPTGSRWPCCPAWPSPMTSAPVSSPALASWACSRPFGRWRCDRAGWRTQ